MLPLRRQGGTAGEDEFSAIAVSPDESLVFAGYTEGDWSVTHLGGLDFLAVGAVASFSETPMITSPAPDEGEDQGTTVKGVLTPILVTVSLLAAIGFWAYRTRKRAAHQSRLEIVESSCQRQRRADELDAWARARARSQAAAQAREAEAVGNSGAPPVARPVGRRELERSGGAVLAEEVVIGSRGRDGAVGAASGQEGDVPYATAVVVPPNSNVDGSGRAWTVVADAEVVDR